MLRLTQARVLVGDFPYVSALVSDPLGPVLIGGSFAAAASTNLARFSDTGVLDPAFEVQTDDTVNAIARPTNTIFLVGGFFTQVNGQPRSGIACLASNGELDSGFAPVLLGDPFAVVFAIAVQLDGKVVVGGAFNSVNGVSCTNIARLNRDGTLDTGFRTVSMQGGQLGSGVYALALDLDGRIVAGGDFASVNGVARTNLVRLNADGSLDGTFAAGTDAAVNAVVVQADNKVLVGGYFAHVNGVGRNGVARLSVDGSLDATFDPGTGADGVVYALALQPDGNVLIGGAFQNVNGVPRGGIARFLTQWDCRCRGSSIRS